MGLVHEAHGNYLSSMTAFRHAKCAISFAGSCRAPCHVDISINLARSLVWAGYASDAEHECEHLQKDGMLDEKGQQIFALALLKTGNTDHALSVTWTLAKNISTLNYSSGVAAVGLIYTSGLLHSFLPTIFQCLCGSHQSVELHSLVTNVKMIIDGSKMSLGVESAVVYLKKVLHMYPDNISIWNQLSCLRLQMEEWMVSHLATKCKIVEPPGSLCGKG